MRGQYEGYREVAGVAPDSQTETYAALKLEIDNWRWAGVPFFIRTGKVMPAKQTEVRLVFKHPPKVAFIPTGNRHPEPSQIVIKIDPGTGIQMILDAMRADRRGTSDIHLDMEFAQEGGEAPTPYEVLLHAAIVGDATAFHASGQHRRELARADAAARQPAAGRPLRPGLVGPGRGREADERLRRLAQALARRGPAGRSADRVTLPPVGVTVPHFASGGSLRYSSGGSLRICG